jgi:hypothetical protein
LSPKSKDKAIIKIKDKTFVKIKEFFRNKDIIKTTSIKAIAMI